MLFNTKSFVFWGDVWGSNPRPMESQSIALPTELTPPPANRLPANLHQALLRILEKHSEFLSLPNLPARILQFNHSNRLSGDSGRIRTRDPRLRRALLYPTELPSHRKTYYFTAKTNPKNRLSIGLEELYGYSACMHAKMLSILPKLCKSGFLAYSKTSLSTRHTIPLRRITWIKVFLD